MEDTLTIAPDVGGQQVPQDGGDPKKKLWQAMSSNGDYTKSFYEFNKQFNNADAVKKLHDALAADGGYTKGLGDFQTQYFPETIEKKNSTSSGGQLSSKDVQDIRNFVTGTTPQDREQQRTKDIQTGIQNQHPLVVGGNQQPKQPKIISDKEATTEAVNRLNNPSIYKDVQSLTQPPSVSDNSDPIGTQVANLRGEQKLTTSLNDNDVSKINETSIKQKQIDLLKDNYFPNGFAAEDWLNQRGGARPNNLTDQIALQKKQQKDNVLDAIHTTTDLYRAANKYFNGYGNEDKANTDKNKEYENGQAADAFLKDPNVIALAQQDPHFGQEYKEAKFNLANHFPSYAMKNINEKIGQKMQDNGDIGWLYSQPSPEKADKAVNQLVQSGDLSEQDKYLYEKNTRPNLGTLKSYWSGSPIPTGDVTRELSSGVEEGAKDVLSSSRDLTNKATLGSLSYFGESDADRTQRLKQQNESTPYAEPNSLLGGAAHFLGYTAPMILGTAVGVPSYVTALAQFHGQNADKARELFPDSEGKQLLYNLIGDGIDVAFGELVGTKKAGQAVKGLFQKDITSTINSLADHEIAPELAQENLFNKLSGYAKSVVKGNTQTASVIQGYKFLHNTLDAAFGKRDFSLEGEAKDAMQNFPSMWLNSTFLSGISSLAKGENEINGSTIRKLASNPELAKQQIEQAALKDINLNRTKQQSLDNLDYAVKVNEELNARPNLSEKQKDRYMMLAMRDKVLNDKLKSIPEKTLKQDTEKQIAANDIEKDRTLNPDMGNKKFIEEMYDNDLLPKGDKRMLEDENGKFSEHKVGGYLKFVAQQANNLDENWQPHETKAPDVSHIPEQVLEAANERWKNEIENSKTPKVEVEKTEPIEQKQNEVEKPKLEDLPFLKPEEFDKAKDSNQMEDLNGKQKTIKQQFKNLRKIADCIWAT